MPYEVLGVGSVVSPTSATAAGPAPASGRADHELLSSAAEQVSAMELEHYPGMSERMLQKLLQDAAAQWGIVAGEIVHRIGLVPAGETIVRVSVASAHRREAFEAAAGIMDALKTSAPFWKREWINGQAHWVDAVKP